MIGDNFPDREKKLELKITDFIKLDIYGHNIGWFKYKINSCVTIRYYTLLLYVCNIVAFRLRGETEMARCLSFSSEYYF